MDVVSSRQRSKDVLIAIRGEETGGRGVKITRGAGKWGREFSERKEIVPLGGTKKGSRRREGKKPSRAVLHKEMCPFNAGTTVGACRGGALRGDLNQIVA